jgi:hypothetical protein
MSPSSTAHAYLAEFTVTYLDSIGNVNTSESWLQGDPDLYYVMGIFENDWANLNSTWSTYFKSGPVDTTGSWNIPDTTISREIDQHGAYFYFALIDDDPDADDLLGDNWFYADNNVSDFSWNNNSAPFHPASLGLDTEGDGWSSNYRLSYNVTITPIPGTAWLLGSGLIAMVGLRRKLKK